MDVFADTLYLHPRPSIYARAWLVLLHALAAAVCVLLAWHRLWLWPVVGVIGISLSAGLCAANLRLAASIVALRWLPDGRWWWQTRAGSEHIGRCIAADVHGASLVVLTLRANGRRWRYRRCVLFADALDATGHRRLRARLRVAPPPTDRGAVDA